MSKRTNKKSIIIEWIVIIVVSISVSIIVVSRLFPSSSEDRYDTADGKGLFVKIEKDYSGTLSTNTSNYHYYYLKDTGIVYVGFISSSGIGYSDVDVTTEVVSPNGNYYLYDVEKQEVVEINKDTN